ncbi:hypothetical protein X560_0835 [Listeria fleischmannii 1991]|uniref:Uncharacterized protein n=1 Tax=Listeria fleischmannii 1991 TaxID=1430899 RepID=A0A0J8GI23_9LIST|nr:hypothetical protein X560_0835 [Listeria fleischmannii 1991]
MLKIKNTLFSIRKVCFFTKKSARTKSTNMQFYIGFDLEIILDLKAINIP